MGLLIILALFPVAWFLQNLIHEGSHLLVGWLVEGRKPTKMIPWPSIRSGRLYFGYYEMGKATKRGSPLWRHVAPLFSSWILMTIFIELLTSTGNFMFAPFFICALVDYSVWMFGYIVEKDGTDGQAFSDLLDKPANNWRP